MKTIHSLLPDLSDIVTHGYQSVKTEETESIIDSSLSLGSQTDGGKPEFIHVSGIPGAGKSTYIADHFVPGYVIFQADAVMMKMSAYHEAVARVGTAAAFASFEMLARVVAFEMLSRALDAKMNVVFEYSLNPVYLSLYEGLRGLGYTTKLIFVETDPETALARVYEREKKVGRHTPADFIHKRMEMAQKLLPAMKQSADAFELIRT